MNTKKELCDYLKISIKDEKSSEILALYTHWLENKKETGFLEKLDTLGIQLNAEAKSQVLNYPFHYVKKPSFLFIDLFAGIGGFRMAAQQLGGKCVFASEWDNAAQETYLANYGEVPFGDITKIDEKLIPDHSLLMGGFPCQPFSNAGLKKGIEDTRGTLFYHIARILKEKQPKAVLLENVRGLISNDKGKTLQTILQTLTGMGYKCNISQEIIDDRERVKELQKEAAKMVFCAKDFGVPQNRPRFYLVMWKNDVNIDHFEYPIPPQEATRVGDILEPAVPDFFTISDRLWEGHQRRRIEHARKGNGFGYCMFNEESPYTSTISRRYYKDGSEILIEQPGRNPRKITPIEAGRLQGYCSERFDTENFIVHQSKTEAYKQFGNSVAVPVVKAIVEQIINQILEN